MVVRCDRLAWLLAGGAMALLAGCMPRATAAPTVVYQCEDVLRLSVQFDPDKARVTLPDGTVLSLPQQPAASGFWYSSGLHELRGKGDEAQWTVGRRVPMACRALR